MNIEEIMQTYGENSLRIGISEEAGKCVQTRQSNSFKPIEKNENRYSVEVIITTQKAFNPCPQGQ